MSTPRVPAAVGVRVVAARATLAVVRVAAMSACACAAALGAGAASAATTDAIGPPATAPATTAPATSSHGAAAPQSTSPQAASPPVAPSPTSQPATAAPDRRALDLAVDALWTALSNEPGRAADAATLRRLFHPQARVLGVDPRVPGAPLRETPLARFLASFEQPSERGFHEREIRRQVEQYGAFAHVLSVVESRFERAAERADYAGINSIQWYWDAGAWRILTLYYHLEDAAAPFTRG